MTAQNIKYSQKDFEADLEDQKQCESREYLVYSKHTIPTHKKVEALRKKITLSQ